MRGVASANDDVIEDADTKNLPGVNKLARDAQVLGGRGRVAGRMVMREDDGSGTVEDGGAEDFAGVNGGDVEQAK